MSLSIIQIDWQKNNRETILIIDELVIEIKQVWVIYVEKHPFNRSMPHTSEKQNSYKKMILLLLE